MASSWKSIASVALLASCLSSSWAQSSPAPDPAIVGRGVWTTSGLVHGHPAPQRPRVSEYLGIPYAQSPVGDLRFAPPVAYSSNATVSASAYSPDCPANLGTTPDNYPDFTPQAPRIIKSFAQQLGTAQSEDCLYLNVWSEPEQNKLKPVLVFIHGGRFTVGGANSPYYNGQKLAGDHEVVVVTFNYRMNIFGFSGAPGLPQNVALLDQRLAVEWVHRNIAAFGGDPNRITLFGQSAGGASVDYYSYIWKKPLVSGLISHSGTALGFRPNTAEESAGYFYHVSQTLGCGDQTVDAQTVVQCVRKRSYQDVLKAVAKVPPAESPALPQPVFHPTVDGVTVFDNYGERSATGQFARVPYLLTSNHYEAGYYKVNAFSGNISLSDEQWNQFNLAAFTCPAGAEAKSRFVHGVPVWKARYVGSWANLELYPKSSAYHGSDLPMVFGTASDVSGLPNSPEEDAFANYMASAWVAFAADPQHGLTRLGWPRYDPRGKTLVGLAYKNRASHTLWPSDDYEEGCAALKGDNTPGKGAF